MPFFQRSPFSKSKAPAPRAEGLSDRRALEFDVESFEFVPTGADVGLLRLSGRWFAPIDRALPDVILVATVGGHSVEVTPLPDIDGAVPTATPDGELWRAAFSMSAELVASELTRFELATHGGERVSLPRPGELVRSVDPQVEPAAPEHSSADHEDEDDAVGDEVARLRQELARVRTDLEVERRRHAALEEELRSHATLENDLRNAMAMQEGELAAAISQAAQRARRAEHQRDRAVSAEAGQRPAQPLDAALIERLERARRAADAAA